MAVQPLGHFIIERLPELWFRTGEHLMLTGSSSTVATFIGLPMGVILFRKPWLRGAAVGAIGILQTVPSLAMLAFLLALLHKIGAMPAILALTLYALLPIVRNTLTGLEGVSDQVMEAAKGIGMTEWQQLRMVRIPLAAPVIVAGIRTAAVVGVGIATLSAFIGAGGLGQFINRGLALSNTRLILLGAVPAALLALLIDFAIGAFEWGLKPENKRARIGFPKNFFRLVSLMMPVLLVLAGTAVYVSGNHIRHLNNLAEIGKGRVIVGSKNFTEQLILGEIMAQMIENRTDLEVDRRFNLGGTMICHGALINGEIDLYAEYTGTGLTAILGEPVIRDPVKTLRYVRDAYDKRFNIQWLNPLGFNNTYAITVREDEAKAKGWNKISDLKRNENEIRAGFTAEFAERADGYSGLSDVYHLKFMSVKDLEPSMMYKAVANDEVDVICAFATDGRIASYKLKPLDDDRNFFPPYQAVPIGRKEVLEKNPKLRETLLSLGDILDDATMQRLNFQVDVEGLSPAEVAGSFLKSKGIIE